MTFNANKTSIATNLRIFFMILTMVLFAFTMIITGFLDYNAYRTNTPVGLEGFIVVLFWLVDPILTILFAIVRKKDIHFPLIFKLAAINLVLVIIGSFFFLISPHNYPYFREAHPFLKLLGSMIQEYGLFFILSSINLYLARNYRMHQINVITSNHDLIYPQVDSSHL